LVELFLAAGVFVASARQPVLAAITAETDNSKIFFMRLLQFLAPHRGPARSPVCPAKTSCPNLRSRLSTRSGSFANSFPPKRPGGAGEKAHRCVAVSRKAAGVPGKLCAAEKNFFRIAAGLNCRQSE
jgi:hypothetical protein